MIDQYSLHVAARKNAIFKNRALVLFDRRMKGLVSVDDGAQFVWLRASVSLSDGLANLLLSQL